MRAIGQFNAIPESGVIAERDGEYLMIEFDFEQYKPQDETQEVAENTYAMEYVTHKGETDYGKIVSAIINDKYSTDDVQAIIANYEEARSAEEPSEKEQEYLAEYAEYQEWRRHAKEIAKIVIAMKGV
jgi:hypothetical protein